MDVSPFRVCAGTTPHAGLSIWPRRSKAAALPRIIVTDIARHGLKSGVDVALTGQLADAVSIPIIASGGVKNIYDITALKNREGYADRRRDPRPRSL